MRKTTQLKLQETDGSAARDHQRDERLAQKLRIIRQAMIRLTHDAADPAGPPEMHDLNLHAVECELDDVLDGLEGVRS